MPHMWSNENGGSKAQGNFFSVVGTWSLGLNSNATPMSTPLNSFFFFPQNAITFIVAKSFNLIGIGVQRKLPPTPSIYQDYQVMYVAATKR